MEGRVPMLNCLVQHTLRSLCTSSDSANSSKWVYAVFWRILPRNYPPPKWDHGGAILDRAKGNKRNWILVWEDGFCDFCECERSGSGYVKGRFGADIFFKMSHEVYSFGEGLVGKVAADNSHKWVFRDSSNEKDTGFMSSWNVSLDPQPRAWAAQFKSGIQTIAIISVREGIVQVGSLDKAPEDINLVISIQRKFSYLLSVPGPYAIQRPHSPNQPPHTFKPNISQLLTKMNEAAYELDEKCQLIGSKRLHCEPLDSCPTKPINLGYNSPHNVISGPPHLWSLPPLVPSYGHGGLLTKMPSVAPTSEALGTLFLNNLKNTSQDVKTDEGIFREIQIPGLNAEASRAPEAAQTEKLDSLDNNSSLEEGKKGFESPNPTR